MTGTNPTRDPESVVAAWLDEGPTDLPDATRRAILTALPTTPQAGRGLLAPWRSMFMHTFARGAAVVLLAVVAIGTAALFVGPRLGVGGPSPSALASPIPSVTSTPSIGASDPPLPALDATFVSKSYGFEIRYPAGWTISQGHGPWPFGRTLGPGDPTTDSIMTPGGLYRMRISAASIALPSGTTMEAFRAFASPYSSPFQPDACTPVAPLPGPVTIDDQPGPGKSLQKVQAVVSINGCDALAELGGFVYDIEVIAGGRGYEFVLDGHLAPRDVLAWLATVKLEPATAATQSAAPSPSASK